MTNQHLGHKLFEAVHESQGFAFISDAIEEIEDLLDTEVIEVAEGSLYHTRKTARILQKFIKEHKGKPQDRSVRWIGLQQ